MKTATRTITQIKVLTVLLAFLSLLLSCDGSSPEVTPGTYFISLGDWEQFAPPVEATPAETDEQREQGNRDQDELRQQSFRTPPQV